MSKLRQLSENERRLIEQLTSGVGPDPKLDDRVRIRPSVEYKFTNWAECI